MSRIPLALPATVPDAHFEHLAAVLRLLGHADRLRIVDGLLKREMCVGELAESLGLAANAVSQHLSQMAARQIVRKTSRGRRAYYQVSDTVAKTLLTCLWRQVGREDER